MTRAFQYTISSTLCTRPDALERHAFVHVNGGHTKLVDVETLVVFRVRDRRIEHLLDKAGRFLRAEGQQLQGFFDAPATDLVGDQPGLARRCAGSSEYCCNVHSSFLYSQPRPTGDWPCCSINELFCRRSGCEKCASARIPPACGPPCPRIPVRARAGGRCARRSSGPPSRGKPSSGATRS